jgi:hypothetical protein
MSDYGVSLLYAIVAGLSLEAVWLAIIRPHVGIPRYIRIIAFVGLFLAFIVLALGRAQLFGLAHGQLAWLTRLGFAIYGLAMAAWIAHHIIFAWRHRHAPCKLLN